MTPQPHRRRQAAAPDAPTGAGWAGLALAWVLGGATGPGHAQPVPSPQKQAATFDQRLAAAARTAQKTAGVKVTYPDDWPAALGRPASSLFVTAKAEADWFVLVVSETAGCTEPQCALSYIHGWKAARDDISLARPPALPMGHGVLADFEPAGYSSSRQVVDNAKLHFWRQGAWYEIDADLSRDGKHIGPKAEHRLMLPLGRSAVKRLLSTISPAEPQSGLGTPIAGAPASTGRRP